MVKKFIIRLILISFFLTSIGPLPNASAQTIIDLPAPGVMVTTSNSFDPLELKGILVNVKDPLRFDFLVDKGDTPLYGQPLKDEIIRSAKYFLTCLAVPEEDLWVNLSPYEKDRIVPGNFGTTLMGRDLLEQDYLLKQIMASLSYPENELGKIFWQRVYRKAYELYGTTQIPINTFNKVWILPKSADVYVQGNSAFVVNSQLDVMLEADYKAMAHHQGFSGNAGAYSQIFREVILPELRQEVNTGNNFAVVRQVYNAMILATWYKKHLKDSLLGKLYVGKDQVNGVDIADKNAKQKIYQQYLKAYKKCVYNYIKEDYDPITQQTVPRKYASGGILMGLSGNFGVNGTGALYREVPSTRGMKPGKDWAMATIDVTARNTEGDIVSFPDSRTFTNTNPLHVIQGASAAMISPKIGAALRKMLTPVILLIALSVAAPLAQEMHISHDSMNQYAIVQSNGPITVNELKILGYEGPFAGKDGTLQGVKERARKISNNSYRVPRRDEYLKERAEEFSHRAKPVSIFWENEAKELGITRQISQQIIPNAVGSGIPTLTHVNKIEKIRVVSADRSSKFTISAGSPPPPDEENILPDLKAEWILCLTLAVLGLSVKILSNQIKPRKFKKQSVANLNQSPRLVPAMAGASNSGWGFNVVTSDGPVLPNDDELDWQRRAQAGELTSLPLISSPGNEQRQIPQNRIASKKSRLSAMDIMHILSPVAGIGLAAASYIYGGGMIGAGKVFLTLFGATGLIYGTEVFLHEFIHMAVALLQNPKEYKKILTWRNFTSNYGAFDLLKNILPILKPSKNAGVDLPLTVRQRSFNQKAGFYISTALSMGVIGILTWIALTNPALWPWVISLVLASSTLFYNSLMTDIIHPSASGLIECGDSGYVWETEKQEETDDPVEQFFPPAAQTALLSMRGTSEFRGDQGEGMMTWGVAPDGDIVPIVMKRLKSKRGKPVAQVTQMDFKGKLKKASRQKIRPLPGAVREIMQHDRFLTQGLPSEAGLHPHKGGEQEEGRKLGIGVGKKRRLCLYEAGEYFKPLRTPLSVLIENGDNDNHRKHGVFMSTKRIKEFYPVKLHMKKSVFIEPSAQHPLGYYDYLPTGDAPALAVEEGWYDNQGDLWASSRFAVDEVFYRSDQESMDENMTEQEEDDMGDFFMDHWENGINPKAGMTNEQVLIRPGLKYKNKTLKDSWITKEMADKFPNLRFQYESLVFLMDDAKRKLLEEARKARVDPNSSAVGRTLNRLQDLHPEDNFEDKIDRLVKMTFKRFFTADILEAANEIDQLTEGTGTYSVRILNSKYPEKGVWWTRGQGLALGENKQAGYLAYNSEHTALMNDFGDAPPVKEILFLNSGGLGQLTESFYDHEKHGLAIRAYDPKSGEFLTESQLREWRMELSPDNEYWTPLVKRDPNNVANENIADIPKAISNVRKRWRDPNSFVRQSADHEFNKLASLYVETYIKENSRFYKVSQGNLLYAIDEEARNVQGDNVANVISSARRAALLRAIQNHPRILLYLKSRLDLLVARQADHLSQEIIRGQSSEDDLFPRLRMIDEQLFALMTSEIQKLTTNIINNNLSFLRDFEIEQQEVKKGQGEIEKVWEADEEDGKKLRPRVDGKGMPRKISIGSGEAVFYFSGFEDSLWLGSENYKDMWHSFFPYMPIETDSSNKGLDLKPNDRHQVGRRTLWEINSKSGAMSSSKNMIPVLSTISPNNGSIWTGRVDTLMGLEMGQRYYKGAPFLKCIFPTGNYYPSEVNDVSEVELVANKIEMILYVVERMKKIFPNQRPWGMDVSDGNIRKLEEWEANMLKKAERMTGVNEDGFRIVDRDGQGPAENKEILKNGRLIGKMLKETPMSILFVSLCVFGVIYSHTPFGALAALLEASTKIPVHSSLLGHFTWAILDTFFVLKVLRRAFAWVYRKLSGRSQLWAWLGPPSITIGDIPALYQSIVVSASKRGAMAIQTMNATFNGGNPRDHFGARLLQMLRAGSVEIFGIPEDPRALGDVLMTAGQSNVITDKSIGLKIWDFLGKKIKSGPEIFTIGHGNIDPSKSHHHMNIGPLETVDIQADGKKELKPDVTESMSNFYDKSFDLLDRLIGYNVLFNQAYDYATKWGKWRIWKPWETYSKTGQFTTPSPKGGPTKEISHHDFLDSAHPYSIHDTLAPNGLSQISTDEINDEHIGVHESGEDVDFAQIASKRPGGIDMNSRFMQLNIRGETQNRIDFYDNAMTMPIIKGVIPKVSQIVAVTPQMLKAMLGTGYLN